MRARSTSLIAHKTYWSIRFRYFILKIILIHNTWIWFLFVACKDDRDCSWIVKNIGEGDPLKKYCNRWKQKKAIQECRETCKLCELKWCKFFFQTQLDVVSLRRQARSERGAPDTPPSRLSRAPRLAVSLLLSLSWKTRKNKACFAGYLLLQLTMSSGGAHLWRGKYLPHSQRWIGIHPVVILFYLPKRSFIFCLGNWPSLFLQLFRQAGHELRLQWVILKTKKSPM